MEIISSSADIFAIMFFLISIVVMTYVSICEERFEIKDRCVFCGKEIKNTLIKISYSRNGEKKTYKYCSSRCFIKSKNKSKAKGYDTVSFLWEKNENV